MIDQVPSACILDSIKSMNVGHETASAAMLVPKSAWLGVVMYIRLEGPCNEVNEISH